MLFEYIYNSSIAQRGPLKSADLGRNPVSGDFFDSRTIHMSVSNIHMDTVNVVVDLGIVDFKKVHRHTCVCASFFNCPKRATEVSRSGEDPGSMRYALLVGFVRQIRSYSGSR